MTVMPLFGAPDCCEPPQEAGGPAAESLFLSDEVAFPHPRFPTLMRNIRERRGGKVARSLLDTLGVRFKRWVIEVYLSTPGKTCQKYLVRVNVNRELRSGTRIRFEIACF